VTFLCHTLKQDKISYSYIQGKGAVEWCDDKGVTQTEMFNGFEARWQKECEKKIEEHPVRVVIVDTQFLAEGIDIPGIGLILCLSSFDSGIQMEQAFGRANRMCHRRLLRDKTNIKLARYYYDMTDTKGKSLEQRNAVALREWQNRSVLNQMMMSMSF
jgi:ERCC4-related helicase